MRKILLTSSVLIGVVMVLRWLLRRKVRQKLLYADPSKEEVRQQLTQQYQDQGLDLKAPEVQIQLEAQVEAKKTPQSCPKS